MQINQVKTVPVEAKTLRIHMKVRSTFCAVLLDQDSKEIGDVEHVPVPDFMPGDEYQGDHYGDYLILDIDVDTGIITNWVKPTAEQLEETFVKAGGDDD